MERSQYFWPITTGLAVFAVHAILILFYGVNVPYWDQWDAEANLYIGYIGGNLSVENIFAAHNEHRIFTARIFYLLTFILGNGWSPIIAMIAQAAIAGFTAFYTLKIFFQHSLEIHIRKLFSIIIFCLFIQPLQAENIFWGFQVCFYFLILFSIILLNQLTKPLNFFSMAAILLFSFLLGFTMASGISVVLLAILILWMHPETNRKIIKYLTLFLLLLLLLILFKLFITVPGHDSLKAKGILGLLIAFVKVLGWPWSITGILLVWIPIALIIFNHYSKIKNITDWRKKTTSFQWFALSITVWTLIQLAGIAYARGGHDPFALRYTTLFFFGTISFLFITLAFKKDLLMSPFFIVLLLVPVLVISAKSVKYWPQLSEQTQKKILIRQNILTALEKDDFSLLKAHEPEGMAGHPSAERVWKVIHDQDIKPYLKWIPEKQ